jgi:hypothetical protein
MLQHIRQSMAESPTTVTEREYPEALCKPYLVEYT